MDIEKNSIKYSETYNEACQILIKREFSRLQVCYLEHAGATLYSEIQIENIFTNFKSHVYGNPHSRSVTSKLSEDIIDQTRYDILKFFNADPNEYTCVFISGATGSLKLVAETFDYGNEGTLIYLDDNHTSVLGMRALAPKCELISCEKAAEMFLNKIESSSANVNNTLFVYPAQSNFSGVKYPLDWIEKSQKELNWYCLLDAASFAATNTLDLHQFKPDFVAISFYKIFGYPTGLGALLIKNSSCNVMKKRYYGGGTVFMAVASENVAVLRTVLYERFEDGTVPFLSIISVKHGFDTLKRLQLTMDLVSQHVFNLAKFLYENLKRLTHTNGNKAAVLYHGDKDFDDVSTQGGIVNFNLLRDDGSYVGFAEVMHVCNLHDIQIRTGCFCNPGACQRMLRLTPEDVKFHFESGHVCGDQFDIINGTPTGSVRVSFGYMSTKNDADLFLKTIADYFVTKSIKYVYVNDKSDQFQHKPATGTLDNIFIYPIKSCAAFSIETEWELVKTGLKYDREWMIVTENGTVFSQKHDTRLCLLKPIVKLKENIMELHFPDMLHICVPLSQPAVNESVVSQNLCHSKVCGDRIQAWHCGQKVSNWLSKAFDKPGLKLLRMCSNIKEPRVTLKKGNKDVKQLTLANQAQFLLVNKSSVSLLQKSIESNDFNNLQDLIDRFRANFVVNMEKPFSENNLKQLKIGDTTFKVDGPCSRCQVICIDQNSGVKTMEPLRTISQQTNGKLIFGIYLSLADMKSDKASIRTDSNILGFIE